MRKRERKGQIGKTEEEKGETEREIEREQSSVRETRER